MLKDNQFLQPLEEKELAEVAQRIFTTDFLDSIFGHSYDPVQLIEDYFRILKDPHRPPRSLIFKLGSKPAGFVWFENINWIHRNLLMTIYLLPEFRTRGLGAKALYHAGYLAFKVMNLKKIKSFIYDSNGPMLHILRQLGAVCEGRIQDIRIHQGQYQDAWIFSFTAETFDQSPLIQLGRQRWEIQEQVLFANRINS